MSRDDGGSVAGVEIGRAALMAMIPHQDAMCLWDAVTGWDARSVRLRSGTHRDPDNPLRSDDRLRALHLCEYGAQAMAVHGGLRARASGGPVRPGMLVALRGVQLHVARIDELAGDLQCEAEVLVESDASQQYAFRIECDGVLLAEGRAAVMLGG
ncbi:phosphotransferase [Luteimonas sp. BDR2-5]|uniref:phosphotransferase n=1 Tax=Proluteimonas luteida TaxID=2878685 RepID=UPI001E2DD46C|nr:phosphotransferase [Luteimonas sp. BDR2-5]MCD9030031.1 phosphotransferase [Luteimonas sp. BDR2-5]